MPRKRRKLLFLLAFLLLLVGLPSFLVWREVRQQSLNVSLIASLERNDIPAALAALNAGADANTCDNRKDKPSVSDALHNLWNRLLGRRTKEVTHGKRTALYLLFFNRRSSDYRVLADPTEVSLLKSLLEHGASPNVEDGTGDTPLHRAVSWTDTTSVRALVAHGANANARDGMEHTPLHLAAAYSPDITRILLDTGADMEAKSSFGMTPLCIAAASGKEVTVRLLVERGAKVNVVAVTGDTPLLCAVTDKNLEISWFLLAHDADPNAKDKEGHSVLWHARQTNDPNLISLLKQHGAK